MSDSRDELELERQRKRDEINQRLRKREETIKAQQALKAQQDGEPVIQEKAQDDKPKGFWGRIKQKVDKDYVRKDGKSPSIMPKPLNYFVKIFNAIFPEFSSFVTSPAATKMGGMKFWIATNYGDFAMKHKDKELFLYQHGRGNNKDFSVQAFGARDFDLKNLSVLRIANNITIVPLIHTGFEYLKFLAGYGIDKLTGNDKNDTTTVLSDQKTSAVVAKIAIQILLLPIELPLLIVAKGLDLIPRVLAAAGRGIKSLAGKIKDAVASRSSQQPSSQFDLELLQESKDNTNQLASPSNQTKLSTNDEMGPSPNPDANSTNSSVESPVPNTVLKEQSVEHVQIVIDDNDSNDEEDEMKLAEAENTSRLEESVYDKPSMNTANIHSMLSQSQQQTISHGSNNSAVTAESGEDNNNQATQPRTLSTSTNVPVNSPTGTPSMARKNSVFDYLGRKEGGVTEAFKKGVERGGHTIKEPDETPRPGGRRNTTV